MGPEAIERLREILAARPGLALTDDTRRPAAVLVPLFVRDRATHVVLTKKTTHLRSHKGQVSFPGGSWDPQDGSLERTALREAEEEAGIRPDDVEIIGTLDDLPTATTGYLVRPFVAVIPHPYTFVPDGFEVERVFTAPLGAFTDPRIERWEQHDVYFFDVEGEVVWGATARMIVGLVALLG